MKVFYTFICLCFFISCRKEQITPVVIDVKLATADNLTSPVYVSIINKTQNANRYQWTFEGGEPSGSSLKDPGVVRFTSPGNHTILLEAWNDGHKAEQSFTVRVDSLVQCSFKVESVINNYAPAEFILTNTSKGAISYQWTFEGAEPNLYSGNNPPKIRYQNPGEYTIVLNANNGSHTLSYEQKIIVSDSLKADFTIAPSFEDLDDMEAPLRATFKANLQGVEYLYWACEGAIISNPLSADATMLFPNAGTYTVTLNIDNGKISKQVQQSITVKENTNLREHKNIKLGINTAQNSIGAYYSTKLRRIVLSPELSDEVLAKNIDIAFLGLNKTFSYNRFISPDSVNLTPLALIPHAQNTKFINKIELGDLSLSVEQFITMTTDAVLKTLVIRSANYGAEIFDNTLLPRVVLFETQDGRKGAILIKEMTVDGFESYITADIKVQKND